MKPICFTQSMKSRVNLIQNILTETPRMFDQISGISPPCGPVKFTGKIKPSGFLGVMGWGWGAGVKGHHWVKMQAEDSTELSVLPTISGSAVSEVTC